MLRQSTLAVGFAASLLAGHAAQGTSTTLTFSNTQDPWLPFAAIDGVSPSSAVPEPETYALLLAGLGLVGCSGRRRATSPL